MLFCRVVSTVVLSSCWIALFNITNCSLSTLVFCFKVCFASKEYCYPGLFFPVPWAWKTVFFVPSPGGRVLRSEASLSGSSVFSLQCTMVSFRAWKFFPLEVIAMGMHFFKKGFLAVVASSFAHHDSRVHCFVGLSLLRITGFWVLDIMRFVEYLK